MATGCGPAGGEIEAASSASSDRGHEVSILMATVVADGWSCGWQPGAKVSMMNHAAAAAWTGGRRPVGTGDISIGRLGLRLWHGEQFARPRDVVGTGSLGEQAVVAGAVEALG